MCAVLSINSSSKIQSSGNHVWKKKFEIMNFYHKLEYLTKLWLVTQWNNVQHFQILFSRIFLSKRNGEMVNKKLQPDFMIIYHKIVIYLGSEHRHILLFSFYMPLYLSKFTGRVFF